MYQIGVQKLYKSKRYPLLDIIRAIAVINMIIYHALWDMKYVYFNGSNFEDVKLICLPYVPKIFNNASPRELFGSIIDIIYNGEIDSLEYFEYIKRLKAYLQSSQFSLKTFAKMFDQTESVSLVAGKAYLIRDGKRIDINNYPFKIGRGRKSHWADYVIELEFESVSKKHAEIVKIDGKYGLMDLPKDEKRTRINGQLVAPGNIEMYPLVDGTRINLAGVEFEFKIE